MVYILAKTDANHNTTPVKFLNWINFRIGQHALMSIGTLQILFSTSNRRFARSSGDGVTSLMIKNL